MNSHSIQFTSPWGVDAHSQIYGIVNDHGTPDLIAAIATNGRQGYIYAVQLAVAQHMGTPTDPGQAATSKDHGSTTLTVYESDGRTEVGQFVVE